MNFKKINDSMSYNQNVIPDETKMTMVKAIGMGLQTKKDVEHIL